ncbi:MAG: hypothetical protein U0797_24160 [Gemmataceae bacterium]
MSDETTRPLPDEPTPPAPEPPGASRRRYEPLRLPRPQRAGRGLPGPATPS